MRNTAGLLVIAALALAGRAFGQQATFQGLGDLPMGSFMSEALGVSGHGLVAVGNGQNASSNPEAFRWTQAGMVGLGILAGGMGSHAEAASGDGSVVVGRSQSASGLRAFRWTKAGMTDLGVLPGGMGSQAFGTSVDGSVVVGWGSTSGPFEAFRWTQSSGMMVGLGHLPGGMGSQAFGVSADGSVVVGWSTNSAGNKEAFRWTQAGMVGLGSLPGGMVSQALGVSADGSVVVGWGNNSGGNGEAFRWTQAGMVGLGDLPGEPFESRAFAASADGSVVVGWSKTGVDRTEAFIWDATNGMRNLKDVLAGLGANMTGWTLTEARSVSADGLTIVGIGRNPSGTEAWIARFIVPQAEVTLELEGVQLAVGATIRRCVEFVFGGAGGANSPVTVHQDVRFADSDGIGGASARATALVRAIPPNAGAALSMISVKDRKHTLRRLGALTHIGSNQYTASLSLRGGDANNDNLIDIVDFGVLAFLWGQQLNPDTPCTPPNNDAHPDFTGDGFVGTGDYSMIATGWLFRGDEAPGGFLRQRREPKKRATVKEMAGAGVPQKVAVEFDADGDGWITYREIADWLSKRGGSR